MLHTAVDVYSRMVVSARVFDADNADFAVRFRRCLQKNMESGPTACRAFRHGASMKSRAHYGFA